jgi:hypothetical protein
MTVRTNRLRKLVASFTWAPMPRIAKGLSARVYVYPLTCSVRILAVRYRVVRAAGARNLVTVARKFQSLLQVISFDVAFNTQPTSWL